MPITGSSVGATPTASDGKVRFTVGHCTGAHGWIFSIHFFGDQEFKIPRLIYLHIFILPLKYFLLSVLSVAAPESALKSCSTSLTAAIPGL